VYRERGEKTRCKFLSRIKRISEQNLIYVDEAGIEECLFREYARAPIGQKIIGQVSGKKFERTNLIAGLCLGRWVAPRQYNCSTDSGLVEFWFEHCLLKEIKRGKFIIWDNASFHRKTRLSELAATKKCKVIFLPAYSPDLNPIENKWANLMQKLRDILPNFASLDLALQNVFQLD